MDYLLDQLFLQESNENINKGMYITIYFNLPPPHLQNKKRIL